MIIEVKVGTVVARQHYFKKHAVNTAVTQQSE